MPVLDATGARARAGL